MRAIKTLFYTFVLLFLLVVLVSYLPALARYPKLQNPCVRAREATLNIPLGLGDVGRAAWSPDGRFLIFSAARFTVSGRKLWSLYRFDFSSRRTTRIAGYAGRDPVGPLALSSRGQFLAAVFERESGSYIKLVNLETNTFFPLPMPDGAGFLSVSMADSPLAFMPDGSKLLFSGFDGKTHRLCVYDLQSGSSTLLPVSLDAFGATWSPSGDRILFLAREGAGTAVMIASADGSRVSPLFTSGKNCCARYSPFGKKVAFLQADEEQGSATLGVFNVDGSEKDFTRGLPAEARGLTWSSDGGQVFFQARNKREPWEIYAYTVATASLQKLTRKGGNLYPVGNPAAQGLAFVSSRQFPWFYALYEEEKTGAEAIRLTGWFLP